MALSWTRKRMGWTIVITVLVTVLVVVLGIADSQLLARSVILTTLEPKRGG
ncbi:MAG: hypothetical protein ACREU8_11905 [Gammaproteobacteria bacterium]